MLSILRRASIDSIDNRNFNPFVFSRNFHKRLRKIETRIRYIRTIDEEWELRLTRKEKMQALNSLRIQRRRVTRDRHARISERERVAQMFNEKSRKNERSVFVYSYNSPDARTISYASRAKKEGQTSKVRSSKKKLLSISAHMNVSK